MDRNILRTCREDHRRTSADIQVFVTSPNKPVPSRRTIRRRLQVAGLHGRGPVKKPLVSLKTGKLALNGLNSTCPGDLESGLITSGATNQSSICSICSSVPMSDGKTWRWICDGLGMLLRHFHGSIEENCWNHGRCVYQEILENTMRPWAKENLGRSWVFQQDNDPKHTSGHVANWFPRRRVDLLEWPSQSPDLNPIEHMWEELERRLKGVRASNANQKFAQLEAAWKSIPMTPGEQMTNQKEESNSEQNAVILGTAHKTAFFKQLCDAASKYEPHVHYQDVHYLTIEHQGVEHVVEVSDPGLARTGGREMALRNADYVILYYSALAIDSLQALHVLVQPLQTRKNLPILLVCDSDGVEIAEETASANTSSSASEGYESDDRDGMKRHYSMEQIRKKLDDNVDSIFEQGEKLSTELGDRCTYIQLSSRKASDVQKVLTQMITSLNKSAPIRKRRKSIITNILRSKSSDKSVDSPTVEAVNEKKSGKKNGKVEDSKVCIVM
uniref:Tc1-like transposase DDE domain-containing protein n=2 Tax=Caenorhabditis japonica TaxID=281687 RepID=A0A8R1HML2_CAEJA